MDMNDHDVLTCHIDGLMSSAETSVRMLLERDYTQGLMAEALCHALAALTLEVRGLRLSQDTRADSAKGAL